MSVPIYNVTLSQLREWDADPQSPFVLGSDGVWDDLYIIVRALARYGSRIGDVRPMPCGFLDLDDALSSADNLNAWDLEYALSDESCLVAEYEVWHIVPDHGYMVEHRNGETLFMRYVPELASHVAVLVTPYGTYYPTDWQSEQPKSLYDCQLYDWLPQSEFACLCNNSVATVA